MRKILVAVLAIVVLAVAAVFVATPRVTADDQRATLDKPVNVGSKSNFMHQMNTPPNYLISPPRGSHPRAA